MKKILILLIAVSTTLTSFSQIYPYIEDFNAMSSWSNPSGWTCTLPGFQVYPNHGNGSQGLTKNMTALGAAADSVISPLIGPLTASSVLSIQYRVMESSLYPNFSHAMAAGDGIDFYALSGPFQILLYTVDLTNHITDTGFFTLNYNIGALAGNVGNLMIKVRRGAGDFFVDFDNISLTNASSVSDITSITANPVIYPNPANGGTRLLLKNVPADEYRIRLISSSGSVIDLEEKHIEGTLPVINTNQLNRGLYFLQLTGLRNNFLLRFVVKN
jgi:Secretion system C-terminal sorting domain